MPSNQTLNIMHETAPIVYGLTIMEPWASLIAYGAKRVETRSWWTNYRGPIVITAAKRWTTYQRIQAERLSFRRVLEANGFNPTETLGRAIAVVDLNAVARAEDVRPVLSADEFLFGNYTAGRFAWALGRARAIPHPIECTGRQRLWRVSPDLIAEIAAQGIYL